MRPGAPTVLLIGAGRMGGAMLAGWGLAGWDRGGGPAADRLLILDPKPGAEALAAVEAGARLDPPAEALAVADTVVLAVKPQVWRGVAGPVAPRLSPGAVIVSVVAGVAAADISAVFAGRPVARVMPTTAAAIGQGVASLWAADPQARARARALFAPLGMVVDLEDEAQMHAATAASGSAPAYLYAFIEALEQAAAAAGLPSAAATRLARATLTGAAALLARTGEDPAELRRQVTSPGGTTQAALEILMGEGGLRPLLTRAVAAAAARSRALGA